MGTRMEPAGVHVLCTQTVPPTMHAKEKGASTPAPEYVGSMLYAKSITITLPVNVSPTTSEIPSLHADRSHLRKGTGKERTMMENLTTRMSTGKSREKIYTTVYRILYSIYTIL